MSLAMMATTVAMHMMVVSVIRILKTQMVGNVLVVRDISASTIAMNSTLRVFVS
jgi:hypothetical protein